MKVFVVVFALMSAVTALPSGGYGGQGGGGGGYGGQGGGGGGYGGQGGGSGGFG